MLTTAESLPDLLFKAAETWPDRPYLQIRQENLITVLSYATVARDVRELASGLIGQGFKPGDKIGLLSENRAEWVVCYFAILTAGGIVIPLDSLMSADEIANIVVMSGAKVIICSKKFSDAIAASSTASAKIGKQIVFERVGHLPRGNVAGFPMLNRNQTAVIIFTSGTTGYAKGVMLSHHNLLSNVISSLQGCEIIPEDNFHLLLPLHHTFSSTVNMLVPVACGARATFATSYKSRDIVDDIRIAKVSILVGVPQVYENMMKGMQRAISEANLVKRALVSLLTGINALFSTMGLHSGKVLFRSLREKAGLKSVRLMISGGAALPPKVNYFFERLGFTLMQGYGLTETSPVLSVNRPNNNRIGSVGPALPDVELKIDVPDANGIGEICARGENIMQGYYENEQATSDVIRDGWFHTGDAGRMDKDGFLYITGRIKNLIVTGAGKNVYPEEIEARLNLSPYILESLVLGLERRPGSGEELFSVILPDQEFIDGEIASGKTVNLNSEIEKVIDNYNNTVPAYRKIREWTVRAEPFEKTSTRKIKRYLYKHDYSFSN